LIEVAETELPTSSRKQLTKQLTKLGDIFTYRGGSNDVVCQIPYAKKLVQTAHSPVENDWTIGKSMI